MKKVLIIIGSVLLIMIIIFVIVFRTSNKLVCKSKEGNITIMYNDKNIVGYSANGIKYDFEGQKKVAEKIGVEAYMEQFSNWFSTNTTGTCVKE